MLGSLYLFGTSKIINSPIDFFGLLQLYIEGYLQAMLDTVYRQEYLRVRVIDNQVVLKEIRKFVTDKTHLVYVFILDWNLSLWIVTEFIHCMEELHGIFIW